MLLHDAHPVHFRIRAHFLYDRYGWTPAYVGSLPIDEVNSHYELIKQVRKQEQESSNERDKVWMKFFRKLMTGK